MNLIEKVVIKDGVNADTTVTINQYTGQVAEINAKIAHPFIPNTRGIAAYSLDAGITPRFSFAAVGDNEMWVYVDGIGIKVDGITTLAPDTAIKILPNSGSTTYTYSSSDNGKVLIVTDATNLSLIAATPLPINHSFFILNNSDASFDLQAHAGGGSEFMLLTIEPKSFINVYRSGTSVITNAIYSIDDSYKNIGYISSQNTTLSIDQNKFPFYEFAYVGAKTVNIPIGWPSGKELILANIATGNLTINLPDGTTTLDSLQSIILPYNHIAKLVYSGASGYWQISIESTNTIPSIVDRQLVNRSADFITIDKDDYNSNFDIDIYITGSAQKIITADATLELKRKLTIINQTSVSGLGILPQVNLPSGHTFLKGGVSFKTVPLDASLTIVRVGETTWIYY